MPYAIRIDVVHPDRDAFDLHKKLAPLCVSVGPLRADSPRVGKGAGAGSACFFVVAFEIGTDKRAPKLTQVVSEWLTQFIANLQAEKVRVNGRDPKDKAEVHRLILEFIGGTDGGKLKRRPRSGVRKDMPQVRAP